jgi:Zn-dependent protease/CBS domain-containing protein
MRGSIRIGAVHGIPIAIHPSWVFVFGLLAWQLAAAELPGASPGWSTTTYWAAGLVTSLIAFASVLAHELGHSWVAIRNGIPIRSITLFIFGGVSRIAQEPSSPGVELRIALAGPATSLALAFVFDQLDRFAAGAPVLATPAAWLGGLNLTVALFNCLPGFPLDGGRVLRAALWRRMGDLQRATRAAAMVGEGIGFGLMGLGVIAVLHGNVGGLWPILVGWFLQAAAAMSFEQSHLGGMLRGVTVDQVMTHDFARVPRTLPLDRLVEDEVLGRGHRCFLVANNGHLEGLLTLHEVKAVPRTSWTNVTAGEVMRASANVITLRPEDDLLMAMQRMDDAGVGQLPVVSQGTLVGMVSREQLLHYVRARAELGA